jgi:hypothetical protein
LPAYESATTLTEATQQKRTSSANPMIRVRPRAFGGSAYSEVERNAMKSMRASGTACAVIAERLNVPLRSVFKIVKYTKVQGTVGAPRRLGLFTCENAACGKSFRPRRATQRFCSIPCVPLALIKHQVSHVGTPRSRDRAQSAAAEAVAGWLPLEGPRVPQISDERSA